MARPVKFKVQHFVDIATSNESMQIINFSVGGKELMERCGHLIAAYRYFKLGGIKIKLVPASSLPMDPLGLSYDDDDPQTVDPRDQLSPGLVRFTNGEDIFTDVSQLSETQQEAYYNAMMLDPRWFKFGLQSGFSRSAKPIYYQIGQYYQDIYPGAIQNVYRPASTDPLVVPGTASNFYFESGVNAGTVANTHRVFDGMETDPHGFFQTGQKGRFGWLRTDAYQTVGTGSGVQNVAMLTPFPEVRVITAVLPKMRKTIYYYRCYITETVLFSGVRHYSPGVYNESLGFNYVYPALDEFVPPVWPIPQAPPNNYVVTSSMKPMNTGGTPNE